MTDLSQTEAAPFRLDPSPADVLDVRLVDALVALVTFAASLAVLVYSMTPAARFPLCLLLHLAVLVLPAAYLAVRARHNRDLTAPFLLLIATAATGPIGAIGCACMALSLWLRQPSPSRLQQWYDYISGVTARGRSRTSTTNWSPAGCRRTRTRRFRASRRSCRALRSRTSSVCSASSAGATTPHSARSCAGRCATVTDSSAPRRPRSPAASAPTRRAGSGPTHRRPIQSVSGSDRGRA